MAQQQLKPATIITHIRDKAAGEGFDQMLRHLAMYNETYLGAPKKEGYVDAYCDEMWAGGIKYRYYKPDGYIDFLAVDEKWRRCGVGAKLMTAAEAALLQEGVTRLFVDTQTFQGPAFYEAVGFVKCAEIPAYLGDSARITYVKPLVRKEGS